MCGFFSSRQLLLRGFAVCGFMSPQRLLRGLCFAVCSSFLPWRLFQGASTSTSAASFRGASSIRGHRFAVCGLFPSRRVLLLLVHRGFTTAPRCAPRGLHSPSLRAIARLPGSFRCSLIGASPPAPRRLQKHSLFEFDCKRRCLAVCDFFSPRDL